MKYFVNMINRQFIFNKIYKICNFVKVIVDNYNILFSKILDNNLDIC